MRSDPTVSEFGSLENFRIYLPFDSIVGKENQRPDKEKGEQIFAEVVTTEQILGWSDNHREKTKTELEYLISKAFPMMPEVGRNEFVGKFFKQLKGNFRRRAILFRNETNKLIAVSLFDCGEIEYHGKIIKAIYFIMRAISNEYESLGLGKFICSKLLTESQPDILLVTCYQSPSLHSWVGLPQKGLITGYEVYPRMEHREGKDVLITLPYEDIDFVMRVFGQLFPGVVNYNWKRVEYVTRNLTILMTRKNDHDNPYDFAPWGKHGRTDKLAEALGLNDRDGVIVIFRKTP